MPVSHMHSPYAGTLLVFWEITETIEALEALYASEAYHSALPRHVEQRKKSIAARLAAGAAMQILGIPDQSLKKTFDKIPSIDKGYLSLSHTEGLALAMVSTRSRVGVDVELPKAQLKLVSKKYLSKEELKWAKDDVEVLCSLWTAKESVYKACHVPGLSLKDQINLVFQPHRNHYLFNVPDIGVWKVWVSRFGEHYYTWCQEGMYP